MDKIWIRARYGQDLGATTQPQISGVACYGEFCVIKKFSSISDHIVAVSMTIVGFGFWVLCEAGWLFVRDRPEIT